MTNEVGNVPPCWYADPSGQFTHRYWDGAGWTAFVLSKGRSRVDGEWAREAGSRRGQEPRDRSGAKTASGCARCGLDIAGLDRCPDCGLDLRRPNVQRLRQIDTQLLAVEQQLRDSAGERGRLMTERNQLLVALAPPRATAPFAPRAPEWRAESVRDLLLWLGSALVAIAAVTFAAVTWSHLNDGGRAGLLAAVTMLAAAAAAVSYRHLPATADALGALALALVLVDWFAAHHAGLGAGHTPEVWWAAGTALDAALAMTAARWLRTARLASVLLAAVAAVLVVASVTAAPWAAALGLAVVVTATTGTAAVLGRRMPWRAAAVTLGVASGVLGLAALALLSSVHYVANAGLAAGPAAVLAVLAFSPVVARLMVRGLPRPCADVLVGLAVALLLGSGAVLLGAFFSGMQLLAATTVLSAVAVVASRFLPRPVRLGSLAAGTVGVAVGVVGSLGAVVAAMLCPWAWAQKPWSVGAGVEALSHMGPGATASPAGYPALVGLAAAAVAAVVCVRRPPPEVSARWVGGGLAFGAVAATAVLPLAAGLAIAGVLAVQLGVAVATLGAGTVMERSGRREGVMLVGLAVLVAVPAGGWALATRGGTLAGLAVVAVSAAVACRLAAGPPLRRALAGLAAVALIAETGTAIVATGGSRGPAGLAVAVAAGALLAAGAWSRPGLSWQPTLEAVGASGLIAGVLIAAPDPAWRAGALTVVVTALAAAGARSGRRHYLWSATAVAVPAVWAWLAAGHVTLLEAYTLPAAAAALAAGGMTRRRHEGVGSWAAYGSGLALALVPSLGAVIVQGGLSRAILVTAGATLAVVIGAQARLQAPLILGLLTLATLGADTVWPIAAGLPWATLGLSGLLLLWIGITAERRLTELRHVRHGYHNLG